MRNEKINRSFELEINILMRSIYLLFIIFTLIVGCSPSEPSITSEDVNRVQGVIKDYCNATNNKEAAKIPEMIYPGVYSDEVKKEDVEKMFYMQLNQAEKFEFSNISFEEKPNLLVHTETERVFSQKYNYNMIIGLDSLSWALSKNQLAAMASKSDPNAEISDEEREIRYFEKKKLLVVNRDEAFYILPEVFASDLNGSSFNMDSVMVKYNAIP